MFPRGEAGWGLGITKEKPRRVQNAAPVMDDVGVHDPLRGGAEVGITGQYLYLMERILGEAMVEENRGVGTRGGSVTLRDFMAFYLFTRRKRTPRHVSLFQPHVEHRHF